MLDDPIAHLETQALWEASIDGHLLVDANGIVLATNAALDEQFAYCSGDLIGRAIEDLLPPEHRAAHVDHRGGYNDAPQARPMASRNLEGLRSDGTRFPLNISLAPVETSDGLVTFAAVRDLTSRVAHEEAIADATRRRAIAEDHDRIASDLHDSVIQRLFALGLGLQGLPVRIEDAGLAERVSSSVAALDEIILDIRTTIYGLRQRSDGAVRLRTMILSLADEVEPNLGFVPDIALAGALDSVVDETLKHHVMSVVRELLSNAGRHAGATAVSVSVKLDEALVIEVTDNGCGFDRGNGRSSGLANMQQRAEAYGGSFTVETSVGGGSRLYWSVPADQVF